MQKYQLTIPLPSQGINYTDDSLISDREAAEGTVNVSFKDGVPHTRNGYVKQTLYTHAGEAAAITKLGFHLVGTNERMIFASGGHLYQFNSGAVPIRRDLGTFAGSKINYLAQACELSASYPYTDKVFVVDGVAFKWFDETHGLTAIPPYTPTLDEIAAYGVNALEHAAHEINGQKFILNDDNRIWLGGYGSMVRVSHLGMAGPMPDYWPSNQVFRLPSDCTGMARFMGEVILFTENEAFLVSGSTPNFSMSGFYVNTALPGGYGCSAHDSIATGDNSVYWANKRGIYRYRYLPSGYSIPECVSEFVTNEGTTRTIRKKLDSITDWTKVFASFYDHEYRLYIGSGEVLSFDTVHSTWAFYKYGNSFASATEHNHKLFYGGQTVGTGAAYWIYEMDFAYDPLSGNTRGLSDDGVAFETILKSKVFDFEKAANKKRFRRLYLSLYSELVSYSIDLTYLVDNTSTTLPAAIVNDASAPGAVKTNLNFPIRLKHRQKRYTLQYQLKSVGLNHAWLLLDTVLMLKVKELR